MDKFDKLASYLPGFYRPGANPVITALLEAWATGDESIEAAILETKDQLFVKKADGIWLDRLGSNVGVQRPSIIGLRDSDFRKLIPLLSFVPKQTANIIWDLLTLWYKEDSVYAYSTSSVGEPFSIPDGATLNFLVDREDEIRLVFNEDDFDDNASVTAQELSDVINKKASDLGIVARGITSLATKEKFVRVFTNTPGPSGAVQVSGGTAQAIFQFPQLRATLQTSETILSATNIGDTVNLVAAGATATLTISTEWLSIPAAGTKILIDGAFNATNKGIYSITATTGFDKITISRDDGNNFVNDPAVAIASENDLQTNTHWAITKQTGDTMRMEYKSGPDPDLYKVKEGDVLIISDPFDPANQGSFEITNVTLNDPDGQYSGDYVEFSNTIGVGEEVGQLSDSDAIFFFPEEIDINDIESSARFYEINNNEIKVFVPPDSAVVGRDLNGSAHLNANYTGEVGYIGNFTGLLLIAGDTLYPLTTLYLSRGGTGEFELGENITVGAGTGTIFEIVSQDVNNTILLIFNTAGSFSGKAIGGTSGAIRDFVKRVDPIDGTSFEATVDLIMDPGYKIAWTTNGDELNESVGLVSNTKAITRNFGTNFQQGETITSSFQAISGLVSVTAGTAAVSGAGTFFTTELAIGMPLKIGDEVRIILAITNDTNLTLTSNHSAGALNETAYIGTRSIFLGDIRIDDFSVGDRITGAISGTSAEIITIFEDNGVKGLVAELDNFLPAADSEFTQFERVDSDGGVSITPGYSYVKEAGGVPNPAFTGTIKDILVQTTKSQNLVIEEGVLTTPVNNQIIEGVTSGARAIIRTFGRSVMTFISKDTDPTITSGYIFDPEANFTITSTATTLSQGINSGTSLPYIKVKNLPEDWPSETGYFVLNYGSQEQEGPIKFLTKANNTVLTIDPAHIFENDHASGASVRLVELGSSALSKDGTDYQFILTDSAAAIDILREILRSIVAAGVYIDFNVEEPDLGI